MVFYRAYLTPFLYSFLGESKQPNGFASNQQCARAAVLGENKVEFLFCFLDSESRAT